MEAILIQYMYDPFHFRPTSFVMKFFEFLIHYGCKPLSDIYLAIIISSFCCFSYWIQDSWFDIFHFLSCFLCFWGVLLKKKNLSFQCPKMFPLTFLSRSFIISNLTFEALHHFKLMFVIREKWQSHFILLHVNVQFSQHCLLRSLPFLQYTCLSTIVDNPWIKVLGLPLCSM